MARGPLEPRRRPGEGVSMLMVPCGRESCSGEGAGGAWGQGGKALHTARVRSRAHCPTQGTIPNGLRYPDCTTLGKGAGGRGAGGGRQEPAGTKRYTQDR